MRGAPPPAAVCRTTTRASATLQSPLVGTPTPRRVPRGNVVALRRAVVVVVAAAAVAALSAGVWPAGGGPGGSPLVPLHLSDPPVTARQLAHVRLASQTPSGANFPVPTPAAVSLPPPLLPSALLLPPPHFFPPPTSPFLHFSPPPLLPPPTSPPRVSRQSSSSALITPCATIDGFLTLLDDIPRVQGCSVIPTASTDTINDECNRRLTVPFMTIQFTKIIASPFIP